MNRYLKKLKESKNQSKITSCGIKFSLNFLEGNNKFLIIYNFDEFPDEFYSKKKTL